MAKLRELKNDARHSPLQCAKALVEDIESGKISPRRMIVVVAVGEDDKLGIRTSGIGMDFSPTVIGFLHLVEEEITMRTLGHD